MLVLTFSPVEDHDLLGPSYTIPGIIEANDYDLHGEWHIHYSKVVQSSQPSVNRDMGTNIERWRELVAHYFAPEDIDRALCLMGYESGGNPDAYNPSGARGLMQVLGGWASEYGVSKQDLFNPDINLWIAADLRYKYGWSQWSPYNRGLCR